MEDQNKTEQKQASVTQNEKNTNTVSDDSSTSKSKLPLIIILVVLLLAGLIYLFIRLSPETTARIRDISLILYVLESIVTITALVVLVVQTARLVNFLKYEVAPILGTADKTVKKLSGTVSFLCDNAVEPAINASSTISGIKNAADGVLGIFKKSN